MSASRTVDRIRTEYTRLECFTLLASFEALIASHPTLLMNHVFMRAAELLPDVLTGAATLDALRNFVGDEATPIDNIAAIQWLKHHDGTYTPATTGMREALERLKPPAKNATAQQREAYQWYRRVVNAVYTYLHGGFGKQHPIVREPKATDPVPPPPNWMSHV